MSSDTKIEFAVQMTCESCAKSVRDCLENVPGVRNVSISLETGSVVVETNLPSFEVQQKIEAIGKKTVLRGYAGSAAAVAVLETGDESVTGVVRFVQKDPSLCIIDGTIDNLQKGNYKLTIHECGDLSEGCKSVGDIFDPKIPNKNEDRIYGDLGTFTPLNNGRATFRFEDKVIDLTSVIGRSLVVSREQSLSSKYLSVVCGIIARSSGLFQNMKTICSCDGVTIWDEKNVPKPGL